MKIQTYRSLDDLQKSILEREFLKNPNPTTDDTRRIAEQIGETRKRVKVKYFRIEKNCTLVIVRRLYTAIKNLIKHLNYQVDVLYNVFISLDLYVTLI